MAIAIWSILHDAQSALDPRYDYMALLSDSGVADDISLEDYAAVASLTVLIYDHLLTVAEEVRVIWPTKFTSTKLLFILNRYVSLVTYSLAIILLLDRGQGIIRCSTLGQLLGVLNVFNQAIVEVTLILRTYALYERHQLILLFTCFMGIFPLGMSLLNAVDAGSSPLKGGESSHVRICNIGNQGSLFSVFLGVIMMILFDATIFCLTIGRTIFFIRLSPEIRGSFSLPMLMMRDGSLYFLTMCIVNFVPFLTHLIVPEKEKSFATTMGGNSMIATTISVTMLSRLILNLRMENERIHRGGLSTFSLSRAVFAPRIVAITFADGRNGEEDGSHRVSGHGELVSFSSNATTDVESWPAG